MDPAIKAAAELNAIFHRLEVPCEVVVTAEDGKHVRATTDLAEGVALVEELPIVSWPSTSLLNLHLPFCFHCLRLSSHQLSSADADSASSSAAQLPPSWTSCAQCSSSFCSSACQQSSARVHRLLCGPLAELRLTGGHSSASVSSGITVEALARCVAWVVHRLSTMVEQQQLSYDVLQADYTDQQSSNGCGARTSWSAASLNYQLFAQVVAPFSRLISPPDSVRFDGVSLPAWIETVRSLLAERCVKALLIASGAALGKLQLHSLNFNDDNVDGGNMSTSSAAPLHWAEALMGTLFSADTLRTMVGQMVLNAHGVNDYVLPPPPAAAAVSSTSSEKQEESPKGAFEWVLKGAGLYALLSSFNHSCEPNAAVSSCDETHEIVLKTMRKVRAGEEVSITYIPVTPATTLAERQQLLKNYLFTCCCPRCLREGKV